jgi:putative addiction module component (TIGR02574 family)
MASRTLKHLKEQVLKLPEEERAELVYDVIASLDGDAEGDVEESWADEIVLRIHQLRSGAVQTVSATEAMERIAARIHGSS